MQNEVLLLSIFVAIGIFGIFLAFIAVGFSKTKTGALEKEKNEWAFSNFNDKVFYTFFGYKDPDELVKKLGFDPEEYYRNCKTTRTKPNTRNIAVHYLYGITILIVCIVLTYFVSPVFIIIGIVGFAVMIYMEQILLKQKAKDMRLQMRNDLPRFLDLLEAELSVGLPIETAIYLLCNKMTDTLIAREFLGALNEMQLGLSGWEVALSQVAERYDIDTLTDFVLNVTTSYSRGVSIAETVARKNRDTKEAHILTVEKEAAKEENMVMIPMVIFQFIPMIVFAVFPTIVPILQGTSLF